MIQVDSSGAVGSGALWSTGAVGIDVGGTKMLAVALGPDAEVLARIEQPTPQGDPAALVDALGSLAIAVGRSSGQVVNSVGLGLPGFLGLDGIAQQAPNLPSAVGLDVVGPLSRRLGVPVAIDNDANAAAWGAASTDAPGVSNLAVLTLGTGIGGGFIVNGQLCRGAHGFAGEPGHLIVELDGRECVCGQRGCWEQYASGTALGRWGRDAARRGDADDLLAAAGGRVDAIDGPLVAKMVATGDAGSGAVLDTFVRWLAVGLVTVINLFDPQVVLLGGGVVRVGPDLFARLDEALTPYVTVRRGRSVAIRPTELGAEAGARGAALLGAAAASGQRS